MDSFNEDIDYNRIYGSWNLANRIDKSVDIVTDLTDIVEVELEKKALQGEQQEATNTAIYEAIQAVSEQIDQKLNFQPITDDDIDNLGGW